MNEFTIGFEVDFEGMSERFVSEEAFKTQQKLKDDYMRRDQKHMETISELRKEIEEMRDYIKTLEERINSQKKVINKIYGSSSAANITNSLLDGKVEELNTKIANQSKEITRLLKNQEKLKAEIANDDKTISSLQANNAMLLKKIDELYEGIRNSADLTWKEKYDDLKKKTNDAINALREKCVNAQYGADIWKKDYIISYLEKRIKNLEEENEELNKINNLIHGKE